MQRFHYLSLYEAVIRLTYLRYFDYAGLGAANAKADDLRQQLDGSYR